MKPAPGINAKLRAARSKLKAFQRGVNHFVQGEPYEIRPKLYVNRKDPTLYGVSLRQFKKKGKRLPASRWSILVDELTYHLRSVLDAAVYHLSISSERPEPTKTGFPIVLRKGKLNRHQTRYLTDAQRAFIESVQPYDRPDDPLWLLHEMNRRNKHRTLQFAGVIVGLDQQTLSRNLEITVSDLSLVGMDLRAANLAEDGAEFVNLTYRVTGPKPYVKVNMKFQVDIHFGERIITSDSPAGGLMSQALSRVDEIVSKLYSLS